MLIDENPSVDFSCEYCEKKFDLKKNISAHMKKSCPVFALFGHIDGKWTANNIRKLIQNKYFNEVEYYKITNNQLVEENQLLRSTIDEKEKENTTLKQINTELNEILEKHCNGEGTKMNNFSLTPSNILHTISRMNPKYRTRSQT